MAGRHVFNYSEGDRLGEWSGEHVDDCDRPLDVSIPSIYTSIRLHVTLESGDKLLDDLANPYIDATIDDGPGGLFHFIWPSTGLPKGNHKAVIEFIDTDGKPFTMPTTKEPLIICVGKAP